LAVRVHADRRRLRLAQDSYQLGRDLDDYPLFLAVREQDVDAWEAF